MDRIFPYVAVVRASHRPSWLRRHRPHSRSNLSVQPGEDPAERVVGGNAIGQFQHLAQPSLLAPAERFHVHPAVRTCYGAAERNGEDIDHLWRFRLYAGQRGCLGQPYATTAMGHPLSKIDPKSIPCQHLDAIALLCKQRRLNRSGLCDTICCPSCPWEQQ